MIAIDQDPLAAAGRRVSSSGDIEIWQRPLASGNTAIAIFNHSDQEIRGVVSWETLGIKKNRKVGNLWTHADSGDTSEAYSEAIPSHGLILLRLK